MLTLRLRAAPYKNSNFHRPIETTSDAETNKALRISIGRHVDGVVVVVVVAL